MQPTIAKASGTADKDAATQALVNEYIKRNFSINQQTWEGSTPYQQKQYMSSGLADCVLQLNSLNEVGQEAREQTGADFMKMVHVEKQVIKL